MRIPVNLLVFLAVAGVFYLVVLPKKAAFTQGLLKSLGSGPVSREDSVKAMVEARVLVDICPKADLQEYRPVRWSDYSPDGPEDASITHEFTCDAQQRKFLFRLHYGMISEIVDLR
jgi:hypothetical protein